MAISGLRLGRKYPRRSVLTRAMTKSAQGGGSSLQPRFGMELLMNDIIA